MSKHPGAGKTIISIGNMVDVPGQPSIEREVWICDTAIVPEVTRRLQRPGWRVGSAFERGATIELYDAVGYPPRHVREVIEWIDRRLYGPRPPMDAPESEQVLFLATVEAEAAAVSVPAKSNGRQRGGKHKSDAKWKMMKKARLSVVRHFITENRWSGTLVGLQKRLRRLPGGGLDLSLSTLSRYRKTIGKSEALGNPRKAAKVPGRNTEEREAVANTEPADLSDHEYFRSEGLDRFS